MFRSAQYKVSPISNSCLGKLGEARHSAVAFLVGPGTFPGECKFTTTTRPITTTSVSTTTTLPVKDEGKICINRGKWGSAI